MGNGITASGVREELSSMPEIAVEKEGTSLQDSAANISRPRVKIAYMMSRFPKITETFILYEMLALVQQGLQIELYPLMRGQTKVMHPEAAPMVEKAHYHSFLSWRILVSQFHYLRRKPRAYLGAFWALLRGTWGDIKFFTAAVILFPKMVAFSYQMERDGIDHLHAHFANHPAAAAFVIHRLTGISYSFTAHGTDLHRDRHMLCEKVAEAAYVVTISEYNKRLILSECGEQVRDKVIVLHCGVDTQVFKPHLPKTLHGSDKDPFNILCIGTLHEVKGQAYLIEACRLLHQRGVNFICHFVGDGPDLPTLVKQVAQAEITDRVRFHGRVAREEVLKMLQVADVLATPSVPTRKGQREGIPVVLMEAMSSGVPVVASDLSGIPELVEDGKCGLLVAPRDVQGLADALERLEKDPDLRQRFSQVGRAKVLKEFDLQNNSAKLAKLFRFVS